MPIPTAFSQLSDTPSSNSPAGSETVGPNMNGYIQQAYAFIRMLWEGQAQAGTVQNTYVPLAGGVTLTGALTIPSVTTNTNDASGNGGALRIINGNYGVFIRNDGGNCYLLQTPSGSQSGTWNTYRPFFWNLSNGAVTVDGTGAGVTMGGNLTATGVVTGSNLTASSDERLKEDWRPMKRNFIEKLAALKRGTFKRKGNRKREMGVSAQSLRKFMREAVFVGKDGMLQVAYGNAALVATAELAEEILRLRARLDELESR
jgi:hypothetical protein